MDAIIGGLSDIDKDQPADFSHRLEHVWSHVFPALNALNGSNVLVVWTCNLWQIATMNVRSNGFFSPKMITEKYKTGLVNNMTLHIRSLEKFLLERGNNVIQVVRLMDESYTYTQTVHGGTQHPHLIAINNAWRVSANRTKVLVFDVTKMFLSFDNKRIVMRDDSHPTPWVLSQWWNLYKLVAKLGFARITAEDGEKITKYVCSAACSPY